MSRQSTRAYTAVFTFIKEKFPNIKPVQFYNNYDKAMNETIKKLYPETKIFGNFFSWAVVSLL